MHYSFRNPDESKRGKAILSIDGKPLPRQARQKPDCGNCFVRARWTEENARIYAKWRMCKLSPNEIDTEMSWNFFRLEEAAREIEWQSRHDQ